MENKEMVMNKEMALMVSEEMDFAGELTGEVQTQFCSMRAETPEEKVTLFNALNNANNKIRDNVNKELMIKDVYVEKVFCIDEKTGEKTCCPRTVLIDENGEGYTAVSIGVFSSLKKLFQIFGVPTWEKPVCIVPKLVNKDSKSITTLSVKVK